VPGPGHAALLLIRYATALWQGSLEGGELLGLVGTGWSKRTRWRWVYNEGLACGGNVGVDVSQIFSFIALPSFKNEKDFYNKGEGL
jgi:hypothetical protein